MFLHYLKSALIAIKAQGRYSLVNGLGLVVGLSASLILLMIILSETDFDTYHPEYQQLARLEVIFDSLDNTHIVSVAGAMGPKLVQQGLVAASARLLRQDIKLRIGKRSYLEKQFIYADPSTAKLFQFEVIAGDLEYALARPFGLVITESTAQRWFGDEVALNQRVDNPQGEPFQVLAVVADLPDNTHLQWQVLTGISSLESIEGHNRLDSWMRNDFYTYVRLPEYRSLSELEVKITALLSQPLLKIVPGLELHFMLRPISDIHLHSHAMGEMQVNGDATQVNLFITLIGVILFISLFNYINFATATAGRRGKEIGVRQIVGASRGSMISQFMCESLLLVGAAFALALLASCLMLPWVNQMFGQSLQAEMLLQPRWMLWGLGLFIAVVLGAGFYPALVLSSIPTLSALQGAGFKGRSGRRFRLGVLFAQLACGIGLAIWGGHIYSQMALIERTPLGYQRQDKLVISDVDSAQLSQSFSALKQRLQSHSQIQSVAMAEFIPTQEHGNLVGLRHSLQRNVVLDNVLINTVSANFFNTLGIEVLAGQDFIESQQDGKAGGELIDVRPIVVNQTAVKLLQLGSVDNALGQQLEIGWDPDYNSTELGQIIAVVDDYYTASLDTKPRPMVFINGQFEQAKSNLIVSFQPSSYLASLTQMRTLWSRVFNQRMPHYQLLSSRFSELYRQTQLRGEMVNLFNLLAFIVITFGVLGLCSFSAQRRLKEFSLRQLMGASTTDLAWLLGREFLWCVIVAWLFILFPAWWFTEQWLNQFVVRVEPQWWLYLLTPQLLLLVIFGVVLSILLVLQRTDVATVLRSE